MKITSKSASQSAPKYTSKYTTKSLLKLVSKPTFQSASKSTRELLSRNERPLAGKANPSSCLPYLIVSIVGLLKERPILGDHAKAHTFGLCSENTPIKPRRST